MGGSRLASCRPGWSGVSVRRRATAELRVHRLPRPVALGSASFARELKNRIEERGDVVERSPLLDAVVWATQVASAPAQDAKAFANVSPHLVGRAAGQNMLRIDPARED